jgi:alanine dehydrogenase
MVKKTLLLTNSQIQKLVTMPEVLRVVEQAFVLHGQGCVQMPSKIYLHLDKYNGDFRAMPAYLEGPEEVGFKWVNVHPGNSRFGLPTVMALIVLSDVKTGFPLCIMDGTFITNVRTGAAGGVAAKYLARKNSVHIGLVGCGNQAKSQLEALKEVFAIKSVKVWGNTASTLRKFLKATRCYGLTIQIEEAIVDCVRGADIVVTTTPVRKPIVKSRWIEEGTHINAIGADAKGKEELEPILLKRAVIVVDDWQQASHSGEINVPLTRGFIKKSDIQASLGQVVTGQKRGRVSEKEITVFDSTGLAIQDVAVANLVYRRALKNKLGRWVNFLH